MEARVGNAVVLGKLAWHSALATYFIVIRRQRLGDLPVCALMVLPVY